MVYQNKRNLVLMNARNECLGKRTNEGTIDNETVNLARHAEGEIQYMSWYSSCHLLIQQRDFLYVHCNWSTYALYSYIYCNKCLNLVYLKFLG